MTNASQIEYAKLVEKLSEYLKVDHKTDVPMTTWEEVYKRLRGIQKFFGMTWDKIEKELARSEFPEDWIPKVRADEAFRGYYKIRLELDKMGVLIK
jgi:hypothetical protein